MKKLPLLALLLLPWTVKAQTHLQGQYFIQIEAGAYDRIIPSAENFNARVSAGRYTRRLWESSFFLAFAHKTTDLIETGSGQTLQLGVPVQQFSVGYQLSVLLYQNAMKSVQVKLPVQAQAGYERINRGVTVASSYTIKKGSGFLIGAGAGLELEVRSFVLGVHQQVNFLSGYEKFSTMPYVGYKIHLYR